MKYAPLFAIQAYLALLSGCDVRAVASLPPPQTTSSVKTATPTSKPAAPAAPVPASKSPATQAPAPGVVPDDDRALVIRDGQESWTSASGAARSGYTIVDLGDDWTPFIFEEHRGADGQSMPNRYRRVFLGLANDTLDEDGEPLPTGEKNYLELYGIPPSLGVLRARFLEDEKQKCHEGANLAAMEAVETTGYVAPETVVPEEKRIARMRSDLENARRKAHAQTLAELAAKNPKLEPKVKLVERRAAKKLAMTEVERRLACEGMFKHGVKHVAGIYDDAMRLAVRRFQQKHMIYEPNYLRHQTMDALARAPLSNDHEALVRVLRERVVAATGVVEDGTVDSKSGPATYTGANGQTLPVRNLVEEMTQAAVEQLGLASPEAALAFFKRHSAADFRHLRAAVHLPALPEYYGPNMDLSIVIDRGEVWYDLPWDAAGVRHAQPRKRYPSFHLYVKYKEQRIPLARWQTTIGGWRAEQASDGYEYYRYKGSDVGPRVIRNVVAGPVWIAPESTPIRTLVKPKTVNGLWQRVVNYDELGPGFLSAYGLIAGYLVVPGKGGKPDWDNGIRAHGSSEYLSMSSPEGYSHGCHRLPNHLAIRLYSFILRHRPMRILGDQPANIARQFLLDNDVFEIRVPSRGYQYVLEPPLPVDVLEGEIKGTLKKPILTYVPKPGVRYPGPPPEVPNSAEGRAGGVSSGRSAGGDDEGGAP
ncbi:MAG: hypothetical protein ACLP66_08080 [Polyangia bacterium]|jgi:hypothetical protein